MLKILSFGSAYLITKPYSKYTFSVKKISTESVHTEKGSIFLIKRT